MPAAPKKAAPRKKPIAIRPAGVPKGAPNKSAVADLEKSIGDPESAEIAERLIALGEELHVDLSGDAGELLDSAVRRCNTIAAQTALMGAELIAAKAALPHGEFLPELKKRGIGLTTAKRSMRVCRLLTTSKRPHVAFLKTSPVKLSILAGLDDAEIDEIADAAGTDLEGFLALPRSELARMVRAFERDGRDQDARIADLQAALADSKGAAAWEEHTREVFAAITEKVGVAANQCESITAAMRGWRQTPTKAPGRPGVHGRRVNSHTARLLDLAESLRAQADAVVDAAEETRARIGYDDE